MAKQKLTQVTVQGLATNPNPNALPAGSCAVLQNAVMRRPGVITPSPAWVTRAEPAFGRKLLYSDFNQTVAIVDDTGITPLELPDGLGTRIDGLPINTTGDDRTLSFLPGMTQTAFSHFRSMITESSGIVVNQERWAGLPPPACVYVEPYTTSNGFLPDGFSVAYRCHFSLESTNSAQPYIVDGPVSAIGAYTNDSGVTNGTQLMIFAPPNEPFIIPSECILYLHIYRSTMQEVDSVRELPDDFRRVAQIEITDFTPTFTPIFIDEVTNASRENGLPLYTNSNSQEGGQGSSFAPPAARDICVYKDVTFYGNKTALPTLTMTVPGPFGVLLSDRDREIGIGQRPVFTASLTLGSPDIVFTDPSDVIGVVPGQTLQMTGIPDSPGLLGAIVLSVVGTTVTVDQDAEVTDTDRSGNFFDMIKVRANYSTTFDAQEARVLFFDFDAVAAGTLPGFRMLHPAYDISRSVEGIELNLTYTWQAINTLVDFEVCLTNGQNYYPAYTGDYVTETEPLISLSDIRPNRVFFSKVGKPEEVPTGQFLDIGAGTLYKMWANQSALFCFCTDGLWKITGDGFDFAVYQIDPSCYLVHPDAVTALDNQIFAWVTDGIATVNEDGPTTVSTDAIGPRIRALHSGVVSSGAPYSWGVCLSADNFRNEVWLIAQSFTHEVPETSFSDCITYNHDTKNFSTQNVLGDGSDDLFLSSVYAPNVSRTVFMFGASNEDSTIRLPTDYSTSYTQEYLPLLVWFNPLQTDDKGNLKQWMDVNYFVAGYLPNAAAGQDVLKALFDARGTSTDPTEVEFIALMKNYNDMSVLSRDVHYLVPRRTALSDQQQIGLMTLSFDDEGVLIEDRGFYFELQGFTMRYRVASDTLKRGG